MRFDILTIFPDALRALLSTGILGQAQASGVIDVRLHDLRAFTDDVHRIVDDRPYGGGAGMLMKVEPFVRGIETIKADGAVVRNLHLANSGDSHDQVDAGILVQADDVLIEDNTIENSLFGIHLQQANGNTIRRNRISSKPAPATLRGDGIRMWYSRDNLLLDNQLTGSRDMVFANSPDNRIIGNSIHDPFNDILNEIQHFLS